MSQLSGKITIFANKNMRLTVALEHMRFHSFHGLMPQERKVGNMFEVSAQVWYDIPGNTSPEYYRNIESTVNYAELAETVRSIMDTPHDLLETVALTLRDGICSRWTFLAGGRITVTKLTPPIAIQMGGASVTVEW